MAVAPSQKRLKQYLSDNKKYWVERIEDGCYVYFLVHEKAVGVIDKITKRSFESAINKGVITMDQYYKNQQL